MRRWRTPARDVGAVLSDKISRANRGSASPRCRRGFLLHECQLELAIWKQLVFSAQLVKGAQAFFLLFSKTESQVLPEIAAAKRGIELLFVCDQLVDVCEIFIAQSAESIANRLCITEFRSDEPKRIDERKIDKSFPFPAQIPKPKLRAIAPKTDRLVADEKLRIASGGIEQHSSQPVPFRQQASQQRDRSLRRRVQSDFLRVRNFATMRDDHAVNRPV